MRRIWICICTFVGMAFFFLPASVFAKKVTAADYPLRVHIIFRNGIRHYRGGAGVSSLTRVDGMGEANLFENSQPLGFDFTYNCDQPLTPQPAFETFMAKWKKQGRSIEIVMPIIGGKPGEVDSCELKVTMKQDTVYLRRNGRVVEGSAAQFKQWMTNHQYDPEHGQNQPTGPASAKATPETDTPN